MWAWHKSHALASWATSALQPQVENGWLSMYVPCLLLKGPHVVKNIGIYTHAQGSKWDNELGLSHSAEIHFNGSTLDLYSL